ncbi:alpha/beta hydrolase fold domain-containing protein [Microbacterium sp. G2-8]|uniref:alpha/beta hydrolase fold domain-containing protein n=1 Tax=Microbacterium sp. G2-8 TaxID=2842454 RepID=UPI001C89CA52|nr:alpha/beta hydrolase fold domain-containing protein [Microbacterium sp. G2-8]
MRGEFWDPVPARILSAAGEAGRTHAASAAAPASSGGATSGADPSASQSADAPRDGAAADLRRLLAAIRIDPAPPLPRFERGADETPTAWHDRIAAARHRADAHALAHREAMERASFRLFGATVRELLPPVPDNLRRSEVRVPLGEPSGRRHRIDVAVTSPARPSGSVVVRLHGGGFWMGGGRAARELDGVLVDQLAAGGATVLNVDYRLAPEHRIPDAIEDVRGVLAAVRCGEFGDLDPRRIALVGTSSGANVAAAAALADLGAADPLAGLALIVSSLRLDVPPASMHDDPEAWGERQSQLRGYLGETSPGDPAASPALSPALGSLPPVHAVVARHDEIADGGLELCERVERAGGSAAAHVYEMTHTVAPPHIEAEWVRGVVEFVGRVLG